MNRGAAIARGDILLFLHANMTLPTGTLAAVFDRIQEGYDGGRFKNNFSDYDFMVNRGRRFLTCRLFRTDSPANTAFFGDNGIFVRRDVFEAMGGFKEMPIMEDFDFTRRLMRDDHLYRLGLPPERLARLYEDVR